MRKGLITLGIIAAGCMAALGAACGEDPAGKEHEHQYVWTTVQEADCHNEGLKKGVCSVCGDEKEEPIPKTEHDWIVLGVLKPATCTEDGLRSVECDICGDTDDSQVVPALGHDFGDPVAKEGKAPTCTEAGEGVKTCKRKGCGATEDVSIPATGHKFVPQGVTKASTCTEAGEETGYCLTCNAPLTRPIPAAGHKFSSQYTITKMPTETENGERARLCTVCEAPDESSKETIPAIGSGESMEYEYEFRLVRNDGTRLKRNGVTVAIYDDSGDPEPMMTGKTVNGSFTQVMPYGKYTVKLSDLPLGYTAEAEYSFGAADFICKLPVTGSLLAEDAAIPSGYSYGVGAVMRDFTLTTLENKTVRLGELLETKEIVVLNFWATWCGPCQQEFPALKTVYGEYRDKVAVIAVNSLAATQDTESAVRDFAAAYDLNFDVACDKTLNLYEKFQTGYFPTTVVIDREGVICFVHAAGMTEEEFRTLFRDFAGEAPASVAALPARKETF